MAQTTALSNSALPGKVHVFTAKTAVVVVVFTTIFETPIVLDLHVMLLNSGQCACVGKCIGHSLNSVNFRV